MEHRHDKHDADGLPYRRGVGIVLFNRHNLVWVGRRKDTEPEAWQFPQGGIDEDEKPKDALYRELAEETGIKKSKVDLLAESPDWLTYDLPPDLIGRVWHGRYRGQKQKWYALRFLGHDKDIDLDTHHAEFSTWRWVPLADTPHLIVPFKRAIYVEIAALFRPLAEGAHQKL